MEKKEILSNEEIINIGYDSNSDDDDEIIDDNEKIKKTKKKKRKIESKFDLRFLIRFCRIFFFHLNLFSVKQIFLLIILVICSISVAMLKYLETKFVGNIYESFVKQDMKAIWNNIFIELGLFVCDLFFNVFLFSKLLCIIFAYFWRKNLTKVLLEKYFRKNNYYEILHMRGENVDNPDQRICSDVKDFTDNLSVCFVQGFGYIVQIIVNYAFLIKGGAYILLIPVTLWPMVNICVYALIFSPLAHWIFKRDSREGDFRFLHNRIREYAESISFFKSEETEKKMIEKTFRVLVRTIYVVIFLSFFMDLYSQASAYIPQALTLLFLILIVFSHMKPFVKGLSTGEIGAMMMSYFYLATNTTLAFTMFFSTLGNYGGVVIGSTARIGQMFEVIKEIERMEKKKRKQNVENNENERIDSSNEEKRSLLNTCEYEEDKEINNTLEKDPQLGKIVEVEDEIALDNVNVITPTGKLLIRNVNFSVPAGSSVILMGPSGCGKSSILRCIAGLWNFEGVIKRPNSVFFLPQAPYLIQGSLKDNIIYPLSKESVQISDEILKAVMGKAQVEYLLKRASLHEENVNWNEKLSLGEQQRIAIARIFLHKPRFVILDECSSALDPMNEELVYSQIRKEGISMLSVAHRKSVMKYHDFVVFVNKEEKTCSIRKIVQSDIPSYEYNWKVLHKYDVSSEDREEYEKSLPFSNLEKSDKNLGKAGLNLRLIKRVFRLLFGGIMISHPLWWIFVTACILFGILQSLTPLPITYLTSYQTSAVASLDLGKSLMYCGLFFLSFGTFAVCTGVNTTLFTVLGLLFRKNTVNYLHKRYFKNKMFYKINFLDKEIDNCDQRMCQDANQMTSGFVYDSGGICSISNLFIGSLFGYISTLIMCVFKAGWMILVVSFVILIVVVSIQLVLTAIIGKYSFVQQKREGYFRTSLTRMKDYSEQIAFYNGKMKEREVIEDKLSRLLRNQLILGIWQTSSTFFINLVQNLASVVGYLVLATEISLKMVNISDLSPSSILKLVQNTSQYYQDTTANMVLLMIVAPMLGSFIGYVSRVSQLGKFLLFFNEISQYVKVEKFDELDKRFENVEIAEKRMETIDYVELKNLTLRTPTQKTLFYNLSIKVVEGSHLLINGGLWSTYDNKSVYCPLKIGKDGVFFLPQRPYLTPDSFRSNLIYPDEESSVNDDELLEIVERVNLLYVYKRLPSLDLDHCDDWSSTLSPGEAQRVGLARVLYHKPKFALLDESTSALDPENEILMCELLMEEKITMISVGHRKSLLKFHNHLLKFDDTSSWRFCEKVDVRDEVFKI